MAISPYDDLFLPLPASLSSRYTNTARCTAVTTPSEAATRSPYCLSAACPLDYDDPPLTRFFSCFGYVRSRCENEPFVIRTNSNRRLFLSEQNSLIVTFGNTIRSGCFGKFDSGSRWQEIWKYKYSSSYRLMSNPSVVICNTED